MWLNCQVTKQSREFQWVRSPSMKREVTFMVSPLTRYERKGDCHRRGKEKKSDKIAIHSLRPMWARASVYNNWRSQRQAELALICKISTDFNWVLKRKTGGIRGSLLLWLRGVGNKWLLIVDRHETLYTSLNPSTIWSNIPTRKREKNSLTPRDNGEE